MLDGYQPLSYPQTSTLRYTKHPRLKQPPARQSWGASAACHRSPLTLLVRIEGDAILHLYT
jgi:hypothetical protein